MLLLCFRINKVFAGLLLVGQLFMLMFVEGNRKGILFACFWGNCCACNSICPCKVANIMRFFEPQPGGSQMYFIFKIFTKYLQNDLQNIYKIFTTYIWVIFGAQKNLQKNYKKITKNLQKIYQKKIPKKYKKLGKYTTKNKKYMQTARKHAKNIQTTKIYKQTYTYKKIYT